MKKLLIPALAIVATGAQATIFFDASTPADNATTRADFLAAAGVSAGEYFEDFEGYALNTDMEGASLAGGVTLHNSGTGLFQIRGSGQFGGSNPIDAKGLWQNETAYLEVIFSNPATYFAAYDIDHTGTNVIVTYSDGSSEQLHLDSTGGSGNTAEFHGFVAENGLNITKLQYDSAGDSSWGLDNFEYGAVPEPASLTLLGIGALALLKKRKQK